MQPFQMSKVIRCQEWKPSISLVIPITKSMNQVQWYIYFEKGGKFYKSMGAYFSDDEQGKADVESIIASMKIE